MFQRLFHLFDAQIDVIDECDWSHNDFLIETGSDRCHRCTLLRTGGGVARCGRRSRRYSLRLVK